LRGRPPGRPGSPDRDHHRRPYISPYGTWNPYGFAPWLGGYDPYLFGSGDESDAGNAQAVAQPDYGQQTADQSEPAPRIPYQPSAEPLRAAPASEEAVTLVFKDGRPPEQIHNYLLTRTTLYVQDQHRRSIPVDQIDIAATEKTNKDSGVDFQVPTLPN
jgi:hypothetical protein